jgi:SAM-dependent methyltransferase
MENIEPNTVAGFGDEWERFDQSELGEAERREIFKSYFAIFPWDDLPKDSVGCDIGCGSGRWAKLVSEKVGTLHCLDPSSAIDVARANLAGIDNIVFHSGGVDNLPFAVSSLDFAYSLGVLHHIPDTAAAMASCVNKLKPGAPLLVYLYYAFDNKPAWFQKMWQVSNVVRKIICVQPNWLRYILSQILAILVYVPLAYGAKFGDKLGLSVENWPLSSYRKYSFYTMRTDALDRFGTRLEQRFTRAQITEMMTRCGLENIRFSDAVPFWCAVGSKKAN